MPKYVYDFIEGDRSQADLLGGKGANLAEMTRLGLPVPPGFTVTTDACRAYLATGAPPAGLYEEINAHLREVEARLDRWLGDPRDPLLLAVRSGGRYSMPGMMETILDIGLNDTTVAGLAARTGDERFAWDSYRRLIQMFGRTVHGIPGDEFEHELAALRATAGPGGPGAGQLRDLVDTYKKIFARHVGHDFPQAPHEQLFLAVRAVFESWHSERARIYRRQERIPDDLGTAVNVMAMVFGNLGPDSGTGVAFTRDPATGAPGVYGDYLSDAQGEDVVAGIRNTVPLTELANLDPVSFHRLREIMATLERHYRDLCDVEFTIERGKLWMLQTRVGKRTAAAAFVIAAQLAEEGLITADEALTRVTGAQLAQLMFPAFDTAGAPEPLAVGVGASPGAAVGRVVFDSAAAAASTGPVILVRPETNPDDLPGMIAAAGVLTSRGGKTSHAAVVARGMGRTCVCGAEALTIDVERGEFAVGEQVVRAGEVISIDGTSGRIWRGEVPVQPSPVARYLTGELRPEADPLVAAVHRLLGHADAVRTLGVHANADTPDDARRARELGAEGIGLCRTEHMFLGERRELVERLILADGPAEVGAALDALLPLQRADFVGLLTAMDGLPVTVRLLDPPLHEFLPPLAELTARVAGAQARGEEPGHDGVLLTAVRRMHETNPMLGLRGVRLGLVVPGLFAMQVRALAEAAAQRVRAGGDPRPEIMVPLVGDVRELAAVADEARRVLAGVPDAPEIPIGTMIETPRAALTAGDIAAEARFFSFGTNDLTQMTWAFSRDDVEGAFFSTYLERGIFPVSPFESIDATGVGRLVRLAVAEGRAARPDLTVGVCGEHGGDPDSIGFFAAAGLDYVSCSPYRVPVARLAAGRAAVEARTEKSDSR
ncbi:MULTISPECIES: pyruvate, phosphate dikinase [unclassified Micromonospora]|uniref:pyruvate, phosphate dikinase n=1 Tax=unclassified Micromonospora TaxID=2617518 RepID=UPI001129D3E0|nr:MULTISPECIES: pyruvate, phosphate dikinase [unclassified Micromonospora]MCK1806576.1 pyruvate, phosphate dikinase [Micromonospora sp. R42106]MCK1832535.1 pyruvate, phosphate dikinase [Micromonospora sp. R42003]MCK1847400.1 pyruvate, phosphate dikinase [Micromonospora sp. R42004]MCM1018394.1 pyruvate, phosphate dikinase [Micromonospora sp. XM-20-01]